VNLDISASTYHNGPMRTTVTLDADVYEAAVSLSRLSGERLGKVLSQMARRGLEQKNTPRRKGRQRFPTFDVSPGAPVIPASRIARVVDEEGFF
jgi:hypothetical protein